MRKFGATLAVASLLSSAMAVSYTEIVTWDQLKGSLAGTSHFAAVVEGDTSYHAISLGSSPGITKVENISGVQTTTTLVSTLDWFTASGETSVTPFYGMSISGDFIQFGDTTSDAVWRVNKNTGAITEYVSAAQIIAHTGGTAAQLLTPGDTDPDGEYTFYEGNTDGIYKTNGAGTLTTVLDSAALIAGTGTDSVSGGLTHDAAGNLYWGSNSTDSLWVADTGGVISQVLTEAEIVAVTTEADPGFSDVFYAPDGMVYFYETRSDGIMKFDPSNPASTLAFVIEEADLIAGPAGTDLVFQLTWFDGNLAFHSNSSRGLYVIPEPSTLLLLGFAGLLIRRR